MGVMGPVHLRAYAHTPAAARGRARCVSHTISPMTPMTPQRSYTLSPVFGRENDSTRWGGVKGGGMTPAPGP